MTRPLFEGVRFWVYDNVPMRDRWLGDITVGVTQCLLYKPDFKLT